MMSINLWTFFMIYLIIYLLEFCNVTTAQSVEVSLDQYRLFVRQGDSVNLSCKTNVNVQFLLYNHIQWEKVGRDGSRVAISTLTNVVESLKDQYLITLPPTEGEMIFTLNIKNGVEFGDDGFYKCIMKDTRGNVIAEAQTEVIVMKNMTRITLQIGYTEIDQTHSLPELISLEEYDYEPICKAMGSNPEAVIKMYLDGIEIGANETLVSVEDKSSTSPPRVFNTEKKVLLTLTPDDTRKILKCVAIVHDDPAMQREVSFSLFIHESFGVRLSVDKSPLFVKLGDTVNLRCTTNQNVQFLVSNPIHWEKVGRDGSGVVIATRGNVVESFKDKYLHNLQSNPRGMIFILNFKNGVKFDDDGFYKCIMNHPDGSVGLNVQTEVIVMKNMDRTSFTIESTEIDQTYNQTEPIYLEEGDYEPICKTMGSNPAAVITIYLNDMEIGSNETLVSVEDKSRTSPPRVFNTEKKVLVNLTPNDTNKILKCVAIVHDDPAMQHEVSFKLDIYEIDAINEKTNEGNHKIYLILGISVGTSILGALIFICGYSYKKLRKRSNASTARPNINDETEAQYAEIDDSDLHEMAERRVIQHHQDTTGPTNSHIEAETDNVNLNVATVNNIVATEDHYDELEEDNLDEMNYIRAIHQSDSSLLAETENATLNVTTDNTVVVENEVGVETLMIDNIDSDDSGDIPRNGNDNVSQSSVNQYQILVDSQSGDMEMNSYDQLNAVTPAQIVQLSVDQSKMFVKPGDTVSLPCTAYATAQFLIPHPLHWEHVGRDGSIMLISTFANVVEPLKAKYLITQPPHLPKMMIFILNFKNGAMFDNDGFYKCIIKDARGNVIAEAQTEVIVMKNMDKITFTINNTEIDQTYMLPEPIYLEEGDYEPICKTMGSNPEAVIKINLNGFEIRPDEPSVAVEDKSSTSPPRVFNTEKKVLLKLTPDDTNKTLKCVAIVHDDPAMQHEVSFKLDIYGINATNEKTKEGDRMVYFIIGISVGTSIFGALISICVYRYKKLRKRSKITTTRPNINDESEAPYDEIDDSNLHEMVERRVIQHHQDTTRPTNPLIEAETDNSNLNVVTEDHYDEIDDDNLHEMSDFRATRQTDSRLQAETEKANLNIASKNNNAAAKVYYNEIDKDNLHEMSDTRATRQTDSRLQAETEKANLNVASKNNNAAARVYYNEIDKDNLHEMSDTRATRQTDSRLLAETENATLNVTNENNDGVETTMIDEIDSDDSSDIPRNDNIDVSQPAVNQYQLLVGSQPGDMVMNSYDQLNAGNRF